jgi:hypothetical protein
VYSEGSWLVDLRGKYLEEDTRNGIQVPQTDTILVFDVDTIILIDTTDVSYRIFFFDSGDSIPKELSFDGDLFVSADPEGSKSYNLKLINKRIKKIKGMIEDSLKAVADSSFIGRIGILKNKKGGVNGQESFKGNRQGSID